MTKPVKGGVNRELIVEAELRAALRLDLLVFKYIWTPVSQVVGQVEELLADCTERELE